MRALHQNQQLILKLLLNHNQGATIDEIANHLKVTKTAAKEHILKLKSHGYISFVDSKGAVGRPRRRYLLSPEGHEVFPKQYSWLSHVMLELLASQLDSQGVVRFMEDLADKVSAGMKEKFQTAATSAELLTRINSVMNDLGYQTRLTQKDLRKGAVIEATNCVYHSVAKQHPELCRFDTQLLKNLSGLQVSLETCIARGQSTCRFCLKKKGV